MHGTPFARAQRRTRRRRTTWTGPLENWLTRHRTSWGRPDRCRTGGRRRRRRRSRRSLIHGTRSGLRNDHPRTRRLRNRSSGSYTRRRRWNLWSGRGRSRLCRCYGRHGCLRCRWRYRWGRGLGRHRGRRRSRYWRCGLLHRRRRRGDGKCRTRRCLGNNQARRSRRRGRSLWGRRGGRCRCRGSRLGFHRRRYDCGTRGRRSRGGRSWRRRLLLGTNGVQYVSRLRYVR